MSNTAQKMKFSIKDFLSKCDQFTADLVTFTKKILNEKLYFLCSENEKDKAQEMRKKAKERFGETRKIKEQDESVKLKGIV